MLILGLNAYHGDSSACLVRDGQLIAAVEEERFNRIKHWAGFPAESIHYCLEEGGAMMTEVDHVAISFNPKANLAQKTLFTLAKRPSISSILDRLQRQGKSLSIKSQLALACGVSENVIRARFHNVEHHDAHISSGYYLSPFEHAAVLSIDGMGDFVSTVLATAGNNEYRKLSEVFYPHSLGFLYNAITLYLGFPSYGDEYKVMGLAPYGQPVYLDEFRKIIYPMGDTFELNLDYFRHHKDGISMSWDGGAPKVEPFHSELLEKRLGPALPPRADMGEREQNIAASLQRVTEEIIFHLLHQLHAVAASDNVVLVGGCAMNSVANGKVTTHTPFKNAWIPAGAADNGTCFGAAFAVWHLLQRELKQRSVVSGQRSDERRQTSDIRRASTPQLAIGNAPSASPLRLDRGEGQGEVSILASPLLAPRSNGRFELTHAYWGPSFTTEQCRAAAAKYPVTITELPDDALFDRMVDALCSGKVVGWFQGRMEFGARALGSRSLLADPRRADMRDIVNLKIKFREKFRPFAPSILAEQVHDWFEIDEASPFMEKVLQIRPARRSELPAVTHVDGSGRLQTVTRNTNPRYYDLIARFYHRTGVPVLLNTSLNENEPIVHTPEQAIDCFLRTQMDAIVLENLYLERKAEQ